MSQPADPQLRDRLAEALRTAPSAEATPEERALHAASPHSHHEDDDRYWRCAMCMGEVDTLADAALAVVQAELDQLGFLRATVDLIRRADLGGDEILLGLRGQQISIAVNVSDVFAWGGADAEDITPERLPVLEQAWLDCKAVDAEEWTVELYAARVRGMRPQGAAYPKEADIAALFDACGPQREVGLGNPRKPPTPEPTPKET